MNRLFVSILFMCFLWIHCTIKVDSFYWLNGTWESKKPDGSSRLEVWKTKDDMTLTGLGLRVMGADTTVLEFIELTYKDDAIWYIPTVPDQNNALPVPFKLISAPGSIFTFENLQHDFPQRIIYHWKPVVRHPDVIPSVGDILFARVESLQGKGINYTFLRQ